MTNSLPAPKRRAAQTAMLLLILLGALDQVTVSVALPAIGRHFDRIDAITWVVSAYLIAATAVTPLYGKFSDLYGQRRMVSIAIVTFMLGSALSALAETLPMLVSARVLQGAGAGGLIVLAQAIVADIVPARERGRFQGYSSMVWAAASALGPLLGGAITEHLSWQWVFWINLGPAALAWWLSCNSIPQATLTGKRLPIDWTGALLLPAALTALLLPIVRVGQGVPPFDPSNLGLLTAALMLAVSFIRHQRKSVEPILPMRLLGDPLLRRACTLLFICFFLFVAMTVLLPLRGQMAGASKAAASGVQLMWFTLAIAAAVFVGGRWLLRTGQTRPLQRTGALLVPAALSTLALINPQCESAVRSALAILGAGIGLQISATVVMVQTVVPRDLIGRATAMTSFFRSLGGTVGAAVLGSIVFSLMHESGPALGSNDDAFRAALLAAAGLSLIGIWIVRKLPDLRL